MGYFSIKCRRIRNRKTAVTNIHWFNLWIPSSVILISTYFHQHQFRSHLCIRDNVWDIGHYTPCLSGKSIYDIWVITFWPEAVADDTEVVSPQNKTVALCSPGLPGAVWMRHTHWVFSSPRGTAVSALLSVLSDNVSYRAQLLRWSGFFLMMSETRHSQKCHRIGIRSCGWSLKSVNTFSPQYCIRHLLPWIYSLPDVMVQGSLVWCCTTLQKATSHQSGCQTQDFASLRPTTHVVV